MFEGEEAAAGHDSFGDEMNKPSHLDQEDQHVLPMDKSMEAEQIQLEHLIKTAQAQPLMTAPPRAAHQPQPPSPGTTRADIVAAAPADSLTAAVDNYQLEGHYLPDNVEISRGAIHSG